MVLILLLLKFVQWVVILVSFKGYPVEVVDIVALGIVIVVVVVVNVVQWVVIPVSFLEYLVPTF